MMPTPSPAHPWRGNARSSPTPAPTRACRCGAVAGPGTPFAPGRNRCLPCHRRYQAAYAAAHRDERRRYRGGDGQRQTRNRRERAKRRSAALARGLATAPRRWWTITRVAVELGTSASYARRLARRGRLVGTRDAASGGAWRIDPASVRAYLAGGGR